MSVQDIPLWLLFLLTTLLVMVAIEFGYRIGWASKRRSEDEKEAPVGAIVGTVLALLAFILAFTFGTVSDRYDARKVLVREQAASIRTAYLRSDFLPEPQRGETATLFHDYVALVIEGSDTKNFSNLQSSIADLQSIQKRLWEMAVENVNGGDTSDVSALYIESLNDLSNVLAERVAVAAQARMPTGLWAGLYALILLGMFAVGYQTANAASRRTWMMLVLALGFSIVICMIAALDAPQRGYLPVSHTPLTDLQTWMLSEENT